MYLGGLKALLRHLVFQGQRQRVTQYNTRSYSNLVSGIVTHAFNELITCKVNSYSNGTEGPRLSNGYVIRIKQTKIPIHSIPFPFDLLLFEV